MRVCSKCLIAVNLDPTYSPDQKQKLVGEYNCYVASRRNGSSSPSSPASSPTSYDAHGDGGEPKAESGDDYEKGRYDDDADGGEADEEDEDGDWGDKAFLWKLLKKVENVDRYVLSLQMLHQVISFRQGEDPDADITPLMAYLQKLVDHMGRQLKSLSA